MLTLPLLVASVFAAYAAGIVVGWRLRAKKTGLY